MPVSPDAAASRAYYASFYAVSALLAMEGQAFSKHSAVEAAVHRELVRPGRWPQDLGKGYSVLVELRTLGDYGQLAHVSASDAQRAIETAERILKAVAGEYPGLFSGADGT